MYLLELPLSRLILSVACWRTLGRSQDKNAARGFYPVVVRVTEVAPPTMLISFFSMFSIGTGRAIDIARPVPIVILSPCSSLFQSMCTGLFSIDPLHLSIEQCPHQSVSPPCALQLPGQWRTPAILCPNKPSSKGSCAQRIIPEAAQNQHLGRVVGSIHSYRDTS